MRARESSVRCSTHVHKRSLIVLLAYSLHAYKEKSFRKNRKSEEGWIVPVWIECVKPPFVFSPFGSLGVLCSSLLMAYTCSRAIREVGKPLD